MLEANLEVELELSLEEVGDSEEESNVIKLGAKIQTTLIHWPLFSGKLRVD